MLNNKLTSKVVSTKKSWLSSRSVRPKKIPRSSGLRRFALTSLRPARMAASVSAGSAPTQRTTGYVSAATGSPRTTSSSPNRKSTKILITKRSRRWLSGSARLSNMERQLRRKHLPSGFKDTKRSFKSKKKNKNFKNKKIRPTSQSKSKLQA